MSTTWEKVRTTKPRGLALIASGLALFAIVAAWAFELIGGFKPCALCLTQRIPYYVGIPVLGAALVAASFASRRAVFAALAAIASAVFVIGAGYGVYHSGVEWSFWPGPSACGAAAEQPASINDLLTQLETVEIIRCDEVQGRFLGLSFANYNVLTSLAVALLSLWAAAKAYYGSSSVSQ
ncbi:MAG: disulfide bond formation protein B [Pseudomonadota bacterium]